MRRRRFFVTYVIVLGAFAIFASSAPGVFQTMRDLRNGNSLAKQGNEKIQRSFEIQHDLQANFGVDLIAKSRSIDWKSLSQTQRRLVQGKLALYLTLINQVLMIDAQKAITIDNRTVLLNGRDRAETYQKAIESFERVYGENYRPDARLI